MQVAMQDVLFIFIIHIFLLVICESKTVRLLNECELISCEMDLTVGGEIIQSFSQWSDVGWRDVLEFIHMNDQFIPTGERLVANLANVPAIGVRLSIDLCTIKRNEK